MQFPRCSVLRYMFRSSCRKRTTGNSLPRNFRRHRQHRLRRLHSVPIGKFRKAAGVSIGIIRAVEKAVVAGRIVSLHHRRCRIAGNAVEHHAVVECAVADGQFILRQGHHRFQSTAPGKSVLLNFFGLLRQFCGHQPGTIPERTAADGFDGKRPADSPH